MTHIICRSDDPTWLAERRKRVTASEINVFLGTQPSFYEETKETLIFRKTQKEESDFGERSRRRMAHGREREANALRMAGLLLGFPTARYSYLIGHERWPYLGATLDGLMFPWIGTEPQTDLTSEVGLALEVREVIAGAQEPLLTEVKVSDSGHRYKDKNGPRAGLRAWRDYSPDYHKEQVQTGLWMAGLNHALLVGCLGGDDLIAWYHRRDETWGKVLDHVNEEAGVLLGSLWLE